MLGYDFNGLNSGLCQHAILISGKWTHVNFSSVYWENIETRILLHISSLVLSVAVSSMNTFRVWRPIFEWFPLMIGGSEQTIRLESNITG
jgi:hypothetical protein